jgi:glycosyltransferase involved in cell wall biosynthesis
MEVNVMKNEVSLCMIVKNEEYYLPRCLSSVNNIVDEVIIVDTGSTDKTVEIAKSFGAKVYFFPWNNNFSEARNESLKYASKEWILILDADDELYTEDQKNLIALLNRQLDENAIYNLVKIHHYGYMNKGIESKDKRNRTITLLKEQIKKDPDNYFAYFNLGTEYAGLNDTKKALDYYYKSYEKFDPLNGYSFLLILRIVK